VEIAKTQPTSKCVHHTFADNLAPCPHFLPLASVAEGSLMRTTAEQSNHNPTKTMTRSTLSQLRASGAKFATVNLVNTAQNMNTPATAQTEHTPTPFCHPMVKAHDRITYVYEWPQAFLTAIWNAPQGSLPVVVILEWKGQNGLGPIMVPVRPKFFGLVFNCLENGESLPGGFSNT
jgi:hypothetical protein